jgi:hypothetical protein
LGSSPCVTTCCAAQGSASTETAIVKTIGRTDPCNFIAYSTQGGDEKTTAAERRWEAERDEALPKSLEPHWRTVNGS